MGDLASLYPATCYLLPLGKRLRYRDAGGSLDVAAIKIAARLLPFVGGIDDRHKARVAKRLGRLEKAVLMAGPAVSVFVGTPAPGAGQPIAPYLTDRNAAGYIDQEYGFPILIEVPEGGTRSGVDANGVGWSSTMTGAAYGFVLGTCAQDREEVDVFRGPVPAAQAPIAFVVTIEGEDPERKLFVGFASAADALRCYFANLPAYVFADIHAVPLTLIGELTHHDPEHPGMLAKALEAGTAKSGAAVLVTKGGAMVASFARVELNWNATTRKSAQDKAVEKNVALPGKGSPRSWRATTREAVRCAVEPIQFAAADRLAKALDSATIYQGQTTPIATHPELVDHPSLTAPLSGTYDNPADVGGWIGWIEDDAETWIAFVDVNGKALLWTQREPEGGIIGDPVVLERPDLTQPAPATALDDSARKAVKLPVRILPISKGLDLSTPKEKRIVIGVVLEPEPFDGAGDAHDETYSAEEIERACHVYCASYRNLNDSHGRFISSDRAAVVEVYIAPCDLEIGGSQIKKGSWVQAAKIYDDELWGRALSGELGAWSIEGYAARVPNVGPPIAPTLAA
jgi:hypothetical protein